jgi:hypothetical protein
MLAIRLFFGVAAVFAAFATPGVAAADVAGDATPPVLTLPADITVTAWQPAGAYVSYDVSAWDAEDNASVPVDCTPQSGSLFPLGATTVACSAADSSGNTAAGSFTVTVLKPDTTPPVLNGIPSSPVILEPWDANGASYFYNVWATDNWDGWDPVTCTPAPGFFPIGSTTVQCTATDSWGNTATSSFMVTVLQPLVVNVTVTGGTVNPATGVATIECTRAGTPARASAYLYGDLTQRIGRSLITATFGTMTTGGFIDCSSPATPWSYTAVSGNGLFVAGSANVRATGFAGMVQGSTVTTTIKLKAQK